MARAWVFQDSKQVEKYGEARCSWYVGWYDLAGKQRCKSCGPGTIGKATAEKLKRKREAELLLKTYKDAEKVTWEQFRKEFEANIVEGMGRGTRRLTLEALGQFEALTSPKRMVGITTQTIDVYIKKRQRQPGRRRGDTISPATVNKDLRHLKAALKVAKEWGYLAESPKFRMLKEPGQLPTYVSPEHFAAMYQACDEMKRPKRLSCSAADWWRALLMFTYMTGWRISEVLALKRLDLDLEAGTAITWWEDNKGKRDERVKLHSVVIEHLRKLAGFTPKVFTWRHGRQLYDEFAALQRAAGIELPCPEKHQHTPFCHVYGFHDLRRAFATMNADRLTADALQGLMRHKSYQTTQRYINMARQLDEAVAGLYVPDLAAGQGKAKKG